MQIKSTLTNRSGQVLDIVYNDINSDLDLGDKKIQAVHAYCFYGEKLVLVYSDNKGYWTPPGGGVEKDETVEDAVRREVKEEGFSRQNVSDIKKEAISHEEDFITAIAKNPKDFQAYEKLGDYYMDNGNIKDAKECYRQVLRLSPANREVKMKIRRLEKMLG